MWFKVLITVIARKQGISMYYLGVKICTSNSGEEMVGGKRGASGRGMLQVVPGGLNFGAGMKKRIPPLPCPPRFLLHLSISLYTRKFTLKNFKWLLRPRLEFLTHDQEVRIYF